MFWFLIYLEMVTSDVVLPMLALLHYSKEFEMINHKQYWFDRFDAGAMQNFKINS